MVKYYKTSGDRPNQLEHYEENCWVSVMGPTEEELVRLTTELNTSTEYLRAALDEEENSRIEMQNGQTLIVFNIPIAEKRENTVSYMTIPVGVIITGHAIVTVCARSNTIISDFSDGLVKNIQTAQSTRFVLQILLRMSARFLQYLRQIAKVSNYIEKQLHGTIHNKEIIQLLDLQKSLVYFTASLKSNEITLEKILRGRVLRLSDEDRDLLEDVLIEVKQAGEMSEICAGVLDRTMKAFETISSNNLNAMLRRLIIVVAAVSVPALIFGFYGMSSTNLPHTQFWFPLVLAVCSSAIILTLFFKGKK